MLKMIGKALMPVERERMKMGRTRSEDNTQKVEGEQESEDNTQKVELRLRVREGDDEVEKIMRVQPDMVDLSAHTGLVVLPAELAASGQPRRLAGARAPRAARRRRPHRRHRPRRRPHRRHRRAPLVARRGAGRGR